MIQREIAQAARKGRDKSRKNERKKKTGSDDFVSNA
jgi:hypothetical protein